MRTAALLFGAAFLATAGRAFYLQVLQKEKLVRLAEKQHQRVERLTPARGAIYDSNNDPFAVSIDMDSCYAMTRDIEPENLADVVAKLAPQLGMSRPELEGKLKGARNFVWLARLMAPEQAKKVKELDLEGIYFSKESRRFYPNYEVAASVIGFTGVDPVGLEGVEKKYDRVIAGNAGQTLVTERDALGRNVDMKQVAGLDGDSRGNGIVLTLDKNIQYIAEKELAKAVVKNRAKTGTAVVMDPDTGRVLAMANYPTFNPNSFGKYDSSTLRNRAISDSFEPGSTFKIFLVAAALENRVIRPGDYFNCENGVYRLAGKTIHDTHPYGSLNVQQILKFSSNIGAAKIGGRMGSERLYAALTGFGFGAKSEVDLPGESAGVLRPENKWYGVDLATISFGQGVTATALQITTALSAVANGGNLMKPYLVDRIVDDRGRVQKQFGPQVKRRVISPETAKTVAHMLESVVAEGGTGTLAAVDGFRVAGKTGTAQKVGRGGYSASKRTASFAGFVPLEDPKLAILVVVDEPQTSPYGGLVAAPAFSAIARQALCYLKVPPEQSARRKAAEPAVARHEPPPEQEAVEGGTVEGIASADGVNMPNFRGMSMRQVLRVMERRGLNVKLQGSGRAVAQSPLPGSAINTQDQVWVRFEPSG